MNYYFKNQKSQAQSAVAIGYNSKVDPAPRILATGKGVIAAKILQIADQENIPVKKDENLVKILSLLEQNSFIPIEAYTAVAKILGHIYSFKNEKTDA